MAATLADAKEVAEKLVSALHPRSVIVFGSVAKFGAGEDLDLLIIPEEDGKSKEEAYAEAGKILHPFYERFGIDYFVAKPSLVRELFFGGSPFLRMIQLEGRSLYMKDSTKEWMHSARVDLRSAESLHRDQIYQTACIHAQLALEKALKGLLIDKGWELKKTHNIRELIWYAKQREIQVDIPDPMITLIDSIYRGRYPGEEGLLPTGEPTKTQADEVLLTVTGFFAKHKL